MQQHYFIQMIRNLRLNEEVMLYSDLRSVSEEEAEQTVDFLRSCYADESLDYPHKVPPFDPAAALWAAKVVYIAAQLILCRQKKADDLQHLFPVLVDEKTPSAILSADLCLRFLPHMCNELKLIDSEDPLLGQLEQLLNDWHYSAVNYPLDRAALRTDAIASDPCLLQLYCDRIIRHKNAALAAHPAFNAAVRSSMGLHAPVFWNNFDLATDLHEQH